MNALALRFFAILFGFGLLVSACAPVAVVEPEPPAAAAPDVRNCQRTFAAFRALADAHGARGVRLDAAQLALFVARYNAIPPESGYAPDEVWVFSGPSPDEPALVVLVDDGCIVAYESGPLDQIMAFVLGSQA